MRNYALGLLLISDLVIYLTRDFEISSGSLSFLLTLVVVVFVAFAASAVLRNSKSLKMSRNYTYSGILGVIIGIIFYVWIKSNIEQLTEWFAEHGLGLLLILNVICALTIFFVKKRKTQASTAVE